MAGALVGGSVISAFLQVLFDRMASHEVLDFFRGRKLNEGLLMKLKTTMISVNGLLDDAEEKQMAKLTVKQWLDELKDAVYEADDLLDSIAYEALRSKLEAGSHSIANQVQNFFAFRDPFGKEMEVNLENILDRLEFLLKQKDSVGLNLKEGVEEKPFQQKIPTTSVVDEYGFYGRDGDKNTLIDLLLSDDANVNNLGVIPIVGMGGIGKTTLAQHVYNDSRVQEWFDLKAWVYVSEEFNVFKITKDIFEETTLKTSDVNTLNKLQLELKTRLRGKKFLLVLDDVWNDKYGDWDILRRPLKAGARGSRIVVTTRNQNVASIMCTIPTHDLGELSDDDCWFLFAKHAFTDGNFGSYSTLEPIGREIVRKCKGLPLAAKTLAGLLRSKENAKEWEKVLKSSLWNLSNDNILPALRLSYHYLPSQLKRCFAYCAILPKDYQIRKEKLICLWMAEGFLDQPIGDKEAIELGEEYFQELMSRSFFQQSRRSPMHFVMHDLINDLAKFVFGEFCVRLEDDSSCKITQKTRHLSYLRTRHDALKRFETIHEAKLLRAFLSVSLSSHSIGERLTVRYLSFAGTPIKRLPESVCSLYNLQTLILMKCKDLVELPANMVKLMNLCHLEITDTSLKEMPLHMGKLTKLRKLTDFVLGSHSGSSIKELAELQYLRGKLGFWNLQNVLDASDALQANLKGKKHLEELQLRWNGDTDNSLHDRDVLEQLEPHRNVESLLIVGYGGTRFPVWLVSLRILSIKAFDGVVAIGDEFYGNSTSVKKPFGSLEILRFESMPQWREWISYGDEAFPLLQKLSIKKCPNLTNTLPSNLPSLTMLEIQGCQQLGASLPRAPITLSIKLVDDYRNFWFGKMSSGLQRLKVERFQCHPFDPLLVQMGGLSTNVDEIEIRNCNALKCFPLEHFSRLKTLSISGCANFESLSASGRPLGDSTRLSSTCVLSTRGLPSKLQLLWIHHCNKLFDSRLRWDLPRLPSLSEFLIGTIEEVESFPEEILLPSTVTSLTISSYKYLKYLDSKGLQCLISLRELTIKNCPNLKELPGSMHSLLPCLMKLVIFNCQELVSFPAGGLPSKLESLAVLRCNKLIAGRMQWGLRRLHSLLNLTIGKDKDVESFPDEMLLPCTLTSLKIKDFQNLKSLDYRGLQNLSCLGELKIWKCPMLQSLPVEGLPSSLTSLIISGCSMLKQRCQCENGEDWPRFLTFPSWKLTMLPPVR
ncbi:hypothetical protein GH714_003485 [Hevea brasiliensis]|uniref:Disease resistance RPP13-like protein 1 n=1 Tax=Hevea brasiliensis TaxID=3981 RepID=A0A6A6M012_HEVBR|nr:hypothetical protein GH714_003485 [Hevea brasiliensis]